MDKYIKKNRLIITINDKNDIIPLIEKLINQSRKIHIVSLIENYAELKNLEKNNKKYLNFIEKNKDNLKFETISYKSKLIDINSLEGIILFYCIDNLLLNANFIELFKNLKKQNKKYILLSKSSIYNYSQIYNNDLKAPFKEILQKILETVNVKNENIITWKTFSEKFKINDLIDSIKKIPLSKKKNKLSKNKSSLSVSNELYCNIDNSFNGIHHQNELNNTESDSYTDSESDSDTYSESDSDTDSEIFCRNKSNENKSNLSVNNESYFSKDNSFNGIHHQNELNNTKSDSDTDSESDSDTDRFCQNKSNENKSSLSVNNKSCFNKDNSFNEIHHQNELNNTESDSDTNSESDSDKKLSIKKLNNTDSESDSDSDTDSESDSDNNFYKIKKIY